MENDIRSKLHNELNALHIYPVENEYVIAFEKITPQIVVELHKLGFQNIKVLGIWIEWINDNLSKEFVEISCNKGE